MSAEQMETEADGEDCGGSEPVRGIDPDSHLQPANNEKTLDSFKHQLHASFVVFCMGTTGNYEMKFLLFDDPNPLSRPQTSRDNLVHTTLKHLSV